MSDPFAQRTASCGVAAGNIPEQSGQWLELSQAAANILRRQGSQENGASPCKRLKANTDALQARVVALNAGPPGGVTSAEQGREQEESDKSQGFSICFARDKASRGKSARSLALGPSTAFEEDSRHEEGYMETPPGRKRPRRWVWDDLLSNDSGSSGSLSPPQTLVPSPSSSGDEPTEPSECLQNPWLPREAPAEGLFGVSGSFLPRGSHPRRDSKPGHLHPAMEGDSQVPRSQAEEGGSCEAPSIYEDGANLMYAGVGGRGISDEHVGAHEEDVSAAALAARSLGRVMLLQAERERLRKRLQLEVQEKEVLAERLEMLNEGSGSEGRCLLPLSKETRGDHDLHRLQGQCNDLQKRLREATENNSAVKEYAKDLSETRVLVDALALHVRRFTRMWPPPFSSPLRAPPCSSPGMHTLTDRSVQTEFPQCPNSSPGPIPKWPKPQGLKRTFSAPNIGQAEVQGAHGGLLCAGVKTSLLGAFGRSRKLGNDPGGAMAQLAVGVCLPSPRRGPPGVYEALVAQSVDGDAFGLSGQACGPWGLVAGSGPLDAAALYEQVVHQAAQLLTADERIAQLEEEGLAAAAHVASLQAAVSALQQERVSSQQLADTLQGQLQAVEEERSAALAMFEEEQEACNRLVDELRQVDAGHTPFTFPSHSAARQDRTPRSMAAGGTARNFESGSPSGPQSRPGRRRGSARQGSGSPHVGNFPCTPSCTTWDSLLGDEPVPHSSATMENLSRRNVAFGSPLRTPFAPILPGTAGNWDMGAALVCTPEGRSYAQKTIEAERAAISNLLDGVLEQKRAAEQARDAALARADAAEAQLMELERHFQDVEEAWAAACDQLEQERIGPSAWEQGGPAEHLQLSQGEGDLQHRMPANLAPDLQQEARGVEDAAAAQEHCLELAETDKDTLAARGTRLAARPEDTSHATKAEAVELANQVRQLLTLNADLSAQVADAETTNLQLHAALRDKTEACANLQEDLSAAESQIARLLSAVAAEEMAQPALVSRTPLAGQVQNATQGALTCGGAPGALDETTLGPTPSMPDLNSVPPDDLAQQLAEKDELCKVLQEDLAAAESQICALLSGAMPTPYKRLGVGAAPSPFLPSRFNDSPTVGDTSPGTNAEPDLPSTPPNSTTPESPSNDCLAHKAPESCSQNVAQAMPLQVGPECVTARVMRGSAETGCVRCAAAQTAFEESQAHLRVVQRQLHEAEARASEAASTTATLQQDLDAAQAEGHALAQESQRLRGVAKESACVLACLRDGMAQANSQLALVWAHLPASCGQHPTGEKGAITGHDGASSIELAGEGIPTATSIPRGLGHGALSGACSGQQVPSQLDATMQLYDRHVAVVRAHLRDCGRPGSPNLALHDPAPLALASAPIEANGILPQGVEIEDNPLWLFTLQRETNSSCRPAPSASETANPSPGGGDQFSVEDVASATQIAETDLVACRQTVKELEDKLAACQRRMQAELSQAIQASEALQAELSTAQQSSQRFQAELAGSQKAMQGLEAELSGSFQTILDLEGELATCRERIHALDSESVASSTRVEYLEKKLTASSQKVHSLEAELAAASQSMKLLQKGTGSLEKKLSESTATHARLEGDLQASRDNNKDLVAELAAARALVESLRRELAGLYVHAEALQAELRASDIAKTTLESQVSSSTRSAAVVEGALAASQQEAESLRVALATSHAEKEDLSARLSSRQGELERAAGALSAQEQEVRRIQGELTASHTAREALQETLMKSQEEAAKLTQTLAASQETCCGLHDALSQHKEDAQRLQRELADATAESKNLQQQVDSLEAQLQRLTQQVALVEADLSGWQGRAARLEADNARLTGELAAASATLVQAQEEATSLAATQKGAVLALEAQQGALEEELGREKAGRAALAQELEKAEAACASMEEELRVAKRDRNLAEVEMEGALTRNDKAEAEIRDLRQELINANQHCEELVSAAQADAEKVLCQLAAVEQDKQDAQRLSSTLQDQLAAAKGELSCLTGQLSDAEVCKDGLMQQVADALSDKAACVAAFERDLADLMSQHEAKGAELEKARGEVAALQARLSASVAATAELEALKKHADVKAADAEARLACAKRNLAASAASAERHAAAAAQLRIDLAASETALAAMQHKVSHKAQDARPPHAGLAPSPYTHAEANPRAHGPAHPYMGSPLRQTSALANTPASPCEGSAGYGEGNSPDRVGGEGVGASAPRQGLELMTPAGVKAQTLADAVVEHVGAAMRATARKGRRSPERRALTSDLEDAAGKGRDEGVHPSTALAVSHAHGTDVAHPDEVDNSSRPLAERLTDALAERADVMARLAVAQVAVKQLHRAVSCLGRENAHLAAKLGKSRHFRGFQRHTTGEPAAESVDQREELVREKRVLKAICKMAVAVTTDQLTGASEAVALGKRLNPVLEAYDTTVASMGLGPTWTFLQTLAGQLRPLGQIGDSGSQLSLPSNSPDLSAFPQQSQIHHSGASNHALPQARAQAQQTSAPQPTCSPFRQTFTDSPRRPGLPQFQEASLRPGQAAPPQGTGLGRGPATMETEQRTAREGWSIPDQVKQVARDSQGRALEGGSRGKAMGMEDITFHRHRR